MSDRKDKRSFKRYKIQTEISISSKDKSYKAYTTNYSPKGIGFYIDNSPPMTTGPDVYFTVKELNLSDKGRIVWSEKDNKILKGGIERKNIAGLLKHYQLSDIFMDLQKSMKNGILDFTNKGIIKRIFIKNGDMIYATSNSEEDRFIEVLLNSQKISLDQYYQVINFSKKNGKSHGSALIELKFLKPNELIDAVKQQVEQIIISLFQWENGKFSFIEGPVISDNMIKLKLSTANLIYRGIKRITNIAMINRLMPPKNSILCYSSDPIDLFQDLKLDKDDREILHRIDGKKRIRDIIAESGKDTFQTIKTIYALLNTHLITVKEKDDISEQVSMEDEFLQNDHKNIDKEFIEKVESLYNQLDYLDYYSFLGIPKWATVDKIKKAYYQAAKEFHPDRHLTIQSDTLKSKLNSIFSHLNEIYKVLSNPSARIKYDESLSGTASRVQFNNREMAKLRFHEGEIAYKNGDFSKARELFGQAVYFDSSIANYHYYLGLAYIKENQFHQAVKSIDQAIKLDPIKAEYIAELGHVYMKLGFALRAKSTFEKALKIQSSCKRAQEGLSQLNSNKNL